MKNKYLNIIIIVAVLIIIGLGLYIYYSSSQNLIFKLNGYETVVHNLGDSYNDLGVTITKNGVDVSGDVIVQNNVDPNTIGEYTVTYRYKGKVLTRKVEVKVVDNIILLGDEEVYLLLNGEYDDPKVKAIYEGIDVSNEVIVDSNLDTKKEGEYTITYRFDKMNKTVSRKVYVSDFFEYFKVEYNKTDGTLKIIIDESKISKYLLPDNTQKEKNSTYNVNVNETYKFTIFDHYNNSFEKSITIDDNGVINPLKASCKAIFKDGKTTISITSNKKIVKYIYNGIESTSDTYTFNSKVIDNKVKLYSRDNQEIEVNCKANMGNLEIHFINAGGYYDDAILIRSDEITIFMDGGRGSGAVDKYLKELNVSTIDYVIGSHTEYDHIDAQGVIITNYDVKNVLYPNNILKCGCSCESKDVDKVKKALTKKNMKPIVNEVPFKIELNDITLYFLAPWSIGCNKNDNSFIFILQYGNNKFMFTGDSYSPLQKIDQLTSNAKSLGLSNIKVDVVKYPHHGNQNIFDDFLDAVTPKYFIVPNINASDKPSNSIRNRLKSRGITVYRQSDSKTGNILITSDGNTIQFTMDVKAESYAR